jgi:hypothetical protein
MICLQQLSSPNGKPEPRMRCTSVEPLTLAFIPQHVLLAMDLRLTDGRRVDRLPVHAYARALHRLCCKIEQKTHGASFC